jgi:hypothetical protein
MESSSDHATDAHGSESSGRAGPVPSRSPRFLVWLCAAVPLLGLFELCAHLVQVARVVSDDDWRAASAEVARQVQPDDLVVFAPYWSEPLGRHFFGNKVATLARIARPDNSRFPRAFEVSIRGAHLDELQSWKNVDQKKIGAITITTLENPAPAKVLFDLVTHVNASEARFSLVDARTQTEKECSFVHGAPSTGNIGFGIAIPGSRFACAEGAFAGVTVMPALDYTARQCIFVPPQGGTSISRLRFSTIEFGRAIHGHHGISVFSERDRTGSPVSLAFTIDDKPLGKVTHADGDGWKPFEIDTSAYAGQKGVLTVDVQSASSTNRHYCFEADTR